MLARMALRRAFFSSLVSASLKVVPYSGLEDASSFWAASRSYTGTGAVYRFIGWPINLKRCAIAACTFSAAMQHASLQEAAHSSIAHAGVCLHLFVHAC